MGFEIQIKMEYILIALLVLFLWYAMMSKKREKMVNCGEDADCQQCVEDCDADDSKTEEEKDACKEACDDE